MKYIFKIVEIVELFFHCVTMFVSFAILIAAIVLIAIGMSINDKLTEIASTQNMLFSRLNDLENRISFSEDLRQAFGELSRSDFKRHEEIMDYLLEIKYDAKAAAIIPYKKI